MLLVKSVSSRDGASRSFISSCSTGLPEEAVTDFSGDSVSVKSETGFTRMYCWPTRAQPPYVLPAWLRCRWRRSSKTLYITGACSKSRCAVFLLGVPAGCSWWRWIKAKNNHGLIQCMEQNKCDWIKGLQGALNLLHPKYFIAFSLTVNNEGYFTTTLSCVMKVEAQSAGLAQVVWSFYCICDCQMQIVTEIIQAWPAFLPHSLYTVFIPSTVVMHSMFFPSCFHTSTAYPGGSDKLSAQWLWQGDTV